MNYINFINYLNSTGKDATEFLTLLLMSHNKVATGDLINSLDHKVLYEIDKISLRIISNKTLLYVNDGRKPGGKFPPQKAIEDWINVKKIQPTGITTKQLTFLIQRSIAKNGIEGYPYIKELREYLKSKSPEFLQKFKIDLKLMLLTDFNFNNI